MREGQHPEEFIADYAKAAELALATSASILEANLSCPNIGNEGLVCYNLDITARVAQAIHCIKWAGLEMTERLEKARAGLGARFAIIGCGGVTIPFDFKEYRDRGADVVMSATGAMWNPYLAHEIREAYPKG